MRSRQHQRPRLLVVGPSDMPTGYARIVVSMLSPIHHHYDIHQYSFIRGGDLNHPWPIYTNPDRTDAYGVSALSRLIELLQPDLLLIVFDIWLYFVYYSILQQNFPKLKTLLYCPIDGDNANPLFLQKLQDLSCLVLFTNFAHQVVLTACQYQNNVRLAPIEVIPHSIDLTTFHPMAWELGEPHYLASHTLARKHLFPNQPELQEGFWVLNANHNNSRKRLDLTLRGFAKFADNKPNSVKLYLHTTLDEEGCELLPIARRLGIENRLLWTHERQKRQFASDERLQVIYNACDVGLNTSVGEGWGLVAFEHAATGGAQVLPDHSVHRELWGGVADLIPADQTVRGRHDFVTHRLVDVDAVAEALERLYSQPGWLLHRSKAAFNHARASLPTWPEVAKRWDRLFQRVLNQEK